MMTLRSPRPAPASASALSLVLGPVPGLFLCLALAACGAASEQEGAPSPASAAVSRADVSPAASTALQTRARISRETAEEGRSLRVLVEDLRPGERVVLIALEGPDGARVVAGPDEIRSGSRSGGTGTTRPRVQLEGGNNDPFGVTLSLDVFSSRPEAAETRDSALAWAFLPLPDPAAYAAAPGAWTVGVVLQDEVGRSRELSER